MATEYKTRQQQLKETWETFHSQGIEGKDQQGQFAIRLFPLGERDAELDAELFKTLAYKVIFTKAQNQGYSAWPEVRFKNYFHAYAFAHKLARHLNCPIENCLDEEPDWINK